jgi:hypothetical protein
MKFLTKCDKLRLGKNLASSIQVCEINERTGNKTLSPTLRDHRSLVRNILTESSRELDIDEPNLIFGEHNESPIRTQANTSLITLDIQTPSGSFTERKTSGARLTPHKVDPTRLILHRASQSSLPSSGSFNLRSEPKYLKLPTFEK